MCDPSQWDGQTMAYNKLQNIIYYKNVIFKQIIFTNTGVRHD